MVRSFQKEYYIRKLLSVAQRDYSYTGIKGIPSVIVRKEDLFVCILEGESIYEIGGESFHLHAGDVIFLPRGITYRRTVLVEQYQTVLLYLYFNTEGLSVPVHQLFSSIPGIVGDFIKLYRLWRERESFYQSRCLSLTYDLYVKLLQSKEHTLRQDKHREILEKSLVRIRGHYLEGLSIKELAELADMSEVHFRRMFKQAYGLSPLEYIQALRLERARTLLQKTNYPVDEIARQSGFRDSGYFSRIFKKKTGSTPSEYRLNFIN